MAPGRGEEGADGDQTVSRPIPDRPPIPPNIDPEQTYQAPAGSLPDFQPPPKQPAKPAAPATPQSARPVTPRPRQAVPSAPADSRPVNPRPRQTATSTTHQSGPQTRPSAPPNVPDARRSPAPQEARPSAPPTTSRPDVEAQWSAPATPQPRQSERSPDPTIQAARPAVGQVRRETRQPDPTGAYPQEYGGPERSVTPRRAYRDQSNERGWRERRDEGTRNRVRAREARWQNNRLAVPYPTDGPKITLGIMWFLLLVGGVLLGSYFDQGAIAAVAIAGVAAPVAGLAGLQTGNAWFPALSATRGWTAVAAYLTGIAGFYGPWGVVAGTALGIVTLMFYVTLYRGHNRTVPQLFDVLLRSAIPVGIAVASLAALGVVGIGVQISLILLVSAYEAGDFIVGSGSSNAVEGPMAGLVSLGAVTFLLFLILPAPFEASSILLFAALAAICCPLGQILASALLPRGNAWAPGLRRLDSYLLAAPLWLILAVQLPSLN